MHVQVRPGQLPKTWEFGILMAFLVVFPREAYRVRETYSAVRTGVWVGFANPRLSPELKRNAIAGHHAVIIRPTFPGTRREGDLQDLHGMFGHPTSYSSSDEALCDDQMHTQARE